MTEEQIRSIRTLKTHTVLPTPYIYEFEKQWNEVVELLVNSRVNLAKIKIVEEIKKGN